MVSENYKILFIMPKFIKATKGELVSYKLVNLMSLTRNLLREMVALFSA